MHKIFGLFVIGDGYIVYDSSNAGTVEKEPRVRIDFVGTESIKKPPRQC